MKLTITPADKTVTVWWCNVKEMFTKQSNCGYHAPEEGCRFRDVTTEIH